MEAPFESPDPVTSTLRTDASSPSNAFLTLSKGATTVTKIENTDASPTMTVTMPATKEKENEKSKEEEQQQHQSQTSHFERLFVSAGLTSGDAAQYARSFAEQDVGMSDVGALTHDMLKEMGITKVGHRIKLFKALEQAIREQQTPSSPSASSSSSVTIHGNAVSGVGTAMTKAVAFPASTSASSSSSTPNAVAASKPPSANSESSVSSPTQGTQQTGGAFNNEAFLRLKMLSVQSSIQRNKEKEKAERRKRQKEEGEGGGERTGAGGDSLSGEERKKRKRSRSLRPGEINIAIQQPPRDVMVEIQKIAEYVHRYGLEYEFKLRQTSLSNLPFLSPLDEHHLFYIHSLHLLARPKTTTTDSSPVSSPESSSAEIDDSSDSDESYSEAGVRSGGKRVRGRQIVNIALSPSEQQQTPRGRGRGSLSPTENGVLSTQRKRRRSTSWHVCTSPTGSAGRQSLNSGLAPSSPSRTIEMLPPSTEQSATSDADNSSAIVWEDESEMMKEEFVEGEAPQSSHSSSSASSSSSSSSTRASEAKGSPRQGGAEGVQKESRLSWKESSFMKRYEELKEFKKRYGTCKVPREWHENLSLGNWVYTMRRCKKRGQLNETQIKLLDDIGFIWTARARKRNWDELYEDLKKYKEKYGDTCVPSTFKDDPSLAKWVRKLRLDRKIGALKPEDPKVARLTEIGFDW